MRSEPRLVIEYPEIKSVDIVFVHPSLATNKVNIIKKLYEWSSTDRGSSP